jgi:ribonuclease HI
MKTKLDSIEAYTDGSYLKNGKCGYGVYFPNGELDNISEKLVLKEKTNNRAELYAIKVALDSVLEKYNVGKIYIYTDSEYCLKSLTVYAKVWVKNNWKTANGKDVKNQDLIKPLYDLVQSMKEKIVFIHVLAHTKKQDSMSLNNAMVDELAKAGALK